MVMDSWNIKVGTAQSLKPMLNSTHLEEEHEGRVEGGEGGEETHGGTPDITRCFITEYI